MCVYMLPLGAVWLAGIPAERFSTGAWVDAGMILGGPLLALGVVLAGSLDGLGTFNALTLSLTRLPYAMAEDGLLPRVLAKRWTNGVPWVSVLACSVGWALALGFTFERLISIDLVLYGGSLVLEFVALDRSAAAGTESASSVPCSGRGIGSGGYGNWAVDPDCLCAVGCAGRTGSRAACAWVCGDHCRCGAVGLSGSAENRA